MECSGMSQPLFMVTGSCLGQEIQLETDHVPFGAVWQGSQSSRRILIINSGDIGARLAAKHATMQIPHITDTYFFVATVVSHTISLYIFILATGTCVYSFKWKSEKFAPDFSISPTEGYLSPGMEVCTSHIRLHINSDICVLLHVYIKKASSYNLRFHWTSPFTLKK